MEIPVAKKVSKVVKYGMNGNVFKEVDDPYNWLRYKDDDEDVIKYLNENNNYTEEVMKDTKNQQDIFFKEVKDYILDYKSLALPKFTWDDEFYYFYKINKEDRYKSYYRVNQNSKKEELLIDENEMAKGSKNFDLSNLQFHKTHKVMSYGLDLKGNELYKIKIIKIDTKEEIDNDIPDLLYCIYFWDEDDIFYSMHNENNRIYQVWVYNYMSKAKKLIFQTDNELMSASLYRSSDLTHFFINEDSFDKDKIFYFTREEKEKIFDLELAPKLIVDEDDLKYSIEHYKGNFIILSNSDGARNFKLSYANKSNCSKTEWKDLIPYDENIYVSSFTCLKDYLIISYKENGNNMIKYINFDGEKVVSSTVIEMNTSIKNYLFVDLDIYESDKILFTYESMNQPFSVYEYNLESKNITLLLEKSYNNYNHELYESKRIYANNDGVDVPMSLVYRKDLFKKDGSNPLYLYGYGSYGSTVDPDFDIQLIPLLDRGFVYVIAHVRGGSFLGYSWYEDGKMEKKINTFKDFIKCAEHLISEKYTNSRGITIEGRSAGGLLVGASMTMRPELFRTVIAGVPFVDVLNTMQDETIPLTTQEWEQWGNPNEEKYFNIMSKYCPYTNIGHGYYPNVLALGGINDPRVAFWEPSKFVAKLREYNKNSNLILLKTEMEQGHFAGKDRDKAIEELAFKYSFVLKTYNAIESKN